MSPRRNQRVLESRDCRREIDISTSEFFRNGWKRFSSPSQQLFTAFGRHIVGRGYVIGKTLEGCSRRQREPGQLVSRKRGAVNECQCCIRSPRIQARDERFDK